MAIRQRISHGHETFGMRVERLRLKQRYSKSDLAKAVGVSVTCIWNWEEGNTHPRSAALLRLAKALNTAPEYLETGGSGASEADPSGDGGDATPQGQRDNSLAELILEARETIAAAAGLPPSRVRVVLDYGD